MFSYQLLSPHLLLSLIRKPSKIVRKQGPQVGLGHFEFKLHMGVYLHKLQKQHLILGNYRRFRGQEIAVTNYVSEKTFVF